MQAEQGSTETDKKGRMANRILVADDELSIRETAAIRPRTPGTIFGPWKLVAAI